MRKDKFFWLNPKLKVGDSLLGGKGTFAKKMIKKGEALLIMGGYITPIKEEIKLPQKFNDNGLQISDDLVISVRDENHLGGINFVNHSCNPNAGIKGQIFLVAMKNISGKNYGIQFTFEYSIHGSDFL